MVFSFFSFLFLIGCDEDNFFCDMSSWFNHLETYELVERPNPQTHSIDMGLPYRIGNNHLLFSFGKLFALLHRETKNIQQFWALSCGTNIFSLESAFICFDDENSDTLSLMKYEKDNSSNFQRKWSYAVNYEEINTVVILDDFAIVSFNKEILIFDISNGVLIDNILSSNIIDLLVLNSQLIYWEKDNGEIHSYNLDTLSEEWSYALDLEIYGSILDIKNYKSDFLIVAVYDTRFFSISEIENSMIDPSNFICAINLKSLELIWKTDLTFDSPYSKLTIYKDKIYFGTVYENPVYTSILCMDLNGNVLWKNTIDIERAVPSNILCCDDQLFFHYYIQGSNSRYLNSITVDTGNLTSSCMLKNYMSNGIFLDGFYYQGRQTQIENILYGYLSIYSVSGSSCSMDNPRNQIYYSDQ